MYPAFLAAIPEYKQRVTKLTFSQTMPQNTEIGEEIRENVFFNEATGDVFVLVIEEDIESQEELAADRVDPQGEVL